MNWFTQLFTEPSVAQAVIMYALVVALVLMTLRFLI